MRKRHQRRYSSRSVAFLFLLGAFGFAVPTPVLAYKSGLSPDITFGECVFEPNVNGDYWRLGFAWDTGKGKPTFYGIDNYSTGKVFVTVGDVRISAKLLRQGGLTFTVLDASNDINTGDVIQFTVINRTGGDVLYATC